MAYSRPRRERLPVQRYGFDDNTDNEYSESENEEDQILSSSTSAESENEDSDDNIELGAITERDWNIVLPGADRREQIPIFTGDSGLQINLPENPEDFSLHLLDEHVFTELATFVNSRAALRHYSDVTRTGKRKHTAPWKDIDSSEMKQFFGLILLTGIVKKPRLSDYYSTNTFIETPFFRRTDIMSRDKFKMLLSNFRFAPYTNDNLPRNMQKILPIIDLLRAKSQSLYKIDGKASIDEFLMLYKGRLHMKQYIPKKRSRFGIKGFSLNECSTGYTYDLEIYSGRDGSADWCSTVDHVEELSVSEKIVVHLLNRSLLLDKYFTVIVDNWFNSYRLIAYLLDRRTMCLGTVKCNRGVPKKLEDLKVTAINSSFARKGNVLVVKFVDKRIVYLMSSAHLAQTTEKVRTNKEGQRITFNKPTVIDDYNVMMNGTDRIDQVLASIQAQRKSYVWPTKLGIHLLQRIGVGNGFVLAKKYFPDKMRHKNLYDYEILLIERLFSLAHGGRMPRQLLRQQHYLEKIPSTGQRPRPSLRCVWCRRNAAEGERPRDTRYRCPVCPDKPALHLGNCFQEYHATL